MARWRLTQPHYLNVVGNEWEYTETNKQTGRANRQRFAVPLLLNPNDPADCDRNGEICVYLENSKGIKGPFDHVFSGVPGPDMEPLDDEAKAMSEALAPKWKHPIETLGGDGFANDIMNKLTQQLEAILARSPIPEAKSGPVSLAGVSIEEMAEMKRQMSEMNDQIVQLQAANRALLGDGQVDEDPVNLNDDEEETPAVEEAVAPPPSAPSTPPPIARPTAAQLASMAKNQSARRSI